MYQSLITFFNSPVPNTLTEYLNSALNTAETGKSTTKPIPEYSLPPIEKETSIGVLLKKASSNWSKLCELIIYKPLQVIDQLLVPVRFSSHSPLILFVILIMDA